jgi:hypothetical protein
MILHSDLRKEIGDTVGHFWTIGQIVSRGGMKNIYKYLFPCINTHCVIYIDVNTMILHYFRPLINA